MSSQRQDGNDPELQTATDELLQYRRAARGAADALRHRAQAYLAQGRVDIHDFLMEGIDLEHLPSHVVRSLRDQTLIGSSFAAAMTMTNAFVRAAKKTAARNYLRITNKSHGVKLASDLGLRLATRYQEGVPIRDIDAVPNSVVKPVFGSGSRGVLFHSERDGLLLVRDGRRLDSLTDYQKLMVEWLRTGRLRHDSWIVEELLVGDDGTPAHDLKFYTFYGEVGVTLECKRHSGIGYCFYRGLTPVDTGKHQDKAFNGTGLEEQWLQEMAHLSARIPLPFLRVDMYRTNKGLYFGEFTTVPGKYQQFNIEYDRILGELWNEARARIFSDLLNGKTFPEFSRFAEGA